MTRFTGTVASRTTKAVLTGGLLFFAAQAVSVDAASINLFTREMTKTVNETVATTKKMEADMASVIATQKLQLDAFKASGCQADDSDPGCVAQKKQLRKSFNKLLNGLQDSLGTLQGSLKKTNKGIGARIKSQLGRATPNDLYNAMGGKGGISPDQPAPVDGGVFSSKKGGVSSKVAKIAKMLGTSEGTSTTKLAMTIYADTSQALRDIAVLQGVIQQKLASSGPDWFASDITEEMEMTVASVNALLFGEGEAGVPGPPGPPDGPVEPPCRFC